MPTAIRLVATTALKTSIDDLVSEFERTSGHKIDASYGPSTRIAKQVAEGEPNDVTIVTGDLIGSLIKQGRIVPGTRADIARSAMALAVQKGAPRPDISTAEKFKQALLAAKSLGMSNPVGGGQSGANLARIFDELGITEAMNPKCVYGPGGPAGLIGNFLVRKEVEIGIQQLPELMAVPGIDIVGLLPDGVQSKTVFAAGLSAGATHPDAGRALIAHLATPAAAKVMRDNGMETP
jgi:molybdate transport system substrate-binding protein